MKELAEAIIHSIVDKTDEISVKVVESGATVVIEIKVAKSDMGKVIGKSGKMAWAIRTVLTNAGTKIKKRIIVQFLE
ncbi:MAG: KH domain-containing protein [Deltaproteobacteria bacterium]|nr:KH domain-containing protein [Deltaproteobacteria bacterium]